MRGGEPAYVVRMDRRCSRRCRAYCSGLLLLLSLACYTSVTAAEPDPIYLRFEIFGGTRLHFLTLQAAVGYTRETYSISTEAQTRGFADLLLDLRSRLEVRGKVTAGAPRPEAMRAETHRRGAEYRSRIDYRADGGVSAEVSPQPDSRVTPVTATQMGGTIDQMTAFLALARAVAGRGSCSLGLAVFDGRRRYDLEFADAPGERLPGFGAAQVCRMTRRRIAGFPIGAPGSGATDRGTVWFAGLLPGELAIPVRMEFTGEFGTFTAELAELRGRGVHLRFTE